jgi:hypothetical protein
MLESKIPARLAYSWLDGTPRVVPIWFTYTGGEFVMASPPRAPKLRALRTNPRVALTIDSNDFPHDVLLVRGNAMVTMVDGVAPEYAAAAARYFDDAQGAAWVEQVRAMGVTQMGRIAVRPDWVGILDFRTRFPSALGT